MIERWTTLKSLFRVASVLFKYIRVKWKMVLGNLCGTFHHSLVVVCDANIRIDDITNPWDVNPFVIR